MTKNYNSRYEQTLCWECNRTAKDCKWIRCRIPIEGWDAVNEKWADTDDTTFRVIDCPDFIKIPQKRVDVLDYTYYNFVKELNKYEKNKNQ